MLVCSMNIVTAAAVIKRRIYIASICRPKNGQNRLYSTSPNNTCMINSTFLAVKGCNMCRELSIVSYKREERHLGLCRAYPVIIRGIPYHVFLSPVEGTNSIRGLVGGVVPIHVPICPPAREGSAGPTSITHGPHSYLTLVTGVPFFSPAGGRRRLGFGPANSGVPLIRFTSPTSRSTLKFTTLQFNVSS